jgi:hypothetical protein
MLVFKQQNEVESSSSTPETSIHSEVKAGAGIAKTVKVSVAEVCDYMNCKACRTRRLKAACDSEQKCATVNCVGTVINPNNVLCVAGRLIKEVDEVYLTNIDVTWFGIVEISMSIMKLSKIRCTKNALYLESVSNVVNNALCETNDIYAVLLPYCQHWFSPFTLQWQSSLTRVQFWTFKIQVLPKCSRHFHQELSLRMQQ